MRGTSMDKHPGALTPWRPVQFLGNKLRSLAAIRKAVGEVTTPNGRVWDAFTGSTVVAQDLATHGFSIWATDALASSSVFATAMLGVRREDGGEVKASAEAVATRLPAGPPAAFARWVQLEDEALERRDGVALLNLHQGLPQRWRAEHASSALLQRFERASQAAIAGRSDISGLLSDTYAGTYFGLRQAIELEELRAAIEAEAPGPSWLRSALLTALCSAASAAVYSPGKHFAQSHHTPSDKDRSFHAHRALQDRSIDVSQRFLQAAAEIDRHAAIAASVPHIAEARRVEDTHAERLRSLGVATVYADPPYTAQQYSRFYHVLETLIGGRPPVLQEHRGQVTKGLYPANRYHSPFSSRREAPRAFQALVRTAREAGANAVISYSASAGTTGNARMVSLEDLLAWLRTAYGQGNVEVQQLTHRYRQFNQRSAEVRGRHDPEYLLVGSA